MTRLQLAQLRQEIRGLKSRRNTLEHIAMHHRPMVAASLIERHYPPNGRVAFYLSIPTPQNSWHSYVRREKLDYYRRRAEAWGEYCRAMAEWVQLNKRIEQLMRRLGKGRCERLEIRRKNIPPAFRKA